MVTVSADMPVLQARLSCINGSTEKYIYKPKETVQTLHDRHSTHSPQGAYCSKPIHFTISYFENPKIFYILLPGYHKKL